MARKSSGLSGCLMPIIALVFFVVTTIVNAIGDFIKNYPYVAIVIFFLLVISLTWYWYKKSKKEMESENNYSSSSVSSTSSISSKEYIPKKYKTYISHAEYIRMCETKSIFDKWFSWEDIGKNKKKLMYQSLWDDFNHEINYAPHLADFNRNWVEKRHIIEHFGHKLYLVDDVVYDKFGNVVPGLKPNNYFCLQYPVSTCIIRMSNVSVTKYNNFYQIKDNAKVMEIDYSPEALKEIENDFVVIIREKEREDERRIIEEHKKKMILREKRTTLKKQAMNELVDDGVLFPEAGKRPPIPKDIVDAVWERDGGKCVYCGSKRNLQLDHIIPFSKGGATSIENLQLLCQDCNLKKSNHIGKS